MLLEARIRLQKMLVQTNTLPQDKEYWSAYESATVEKNLVPIEDIRSRLTSTIETLLKLKVGSI